MWCCSGREQKDDTGIHTDNSRSCKGTDEWLMDCGLKDLSTGSHVPVTDEVRYEAESYYYLADKFDATEYSMDHTYKPGKSTTWYDMKENRRVRFGFKNDYM